MTPEQRDSSQSGPVAGDVEEPDSPGRAKVLLVEDDAELRAYLRKHLARHYEILEAARGDHGLGLAREEWPDVIVSDIMMPGLDGYELCRAIKSDPETDFLPVILLTNKGDMSSKIAGLELGADDYIHKPFHPTELLLRIGNLILARARLRARFTAQADRPPLEPTALPLPSSDSGFSARVSQILDRESQEESFGVAALADKLRMSRTHLHRRVKASFELTPSELLIRFRLKRAATMLAQHAGNVGEIAYAVGFRDVSHFVKRFRERYGQTPATYAARKKIQATHPGSE